MIVLPDSVLYLPLPCYNCIATVVIDTLPIDNSPSLRQVWTFLLLQYIIIHHHLGVHPLTVGELYPSIRVLGAYQHLEVFRNKVAIGVIRQMDDRLIVLVYHLLPGYLPLGLVLDEGYWVQVGEICRYGYSE